MSPILFLLFLPVVHCVIAVVIYAYIYAYTDIAFAGLQFSLLKIVLEQTCVSFQSEPPADVQQSPWSAGDFWQEMLSHHSYGISSLPEWVCPSKFKPFIYRQKGFGTRVKSRKWGGTSRRWFCYLNGIFSTVACDWESKNTSINPQPAPVPNWKTNHVLHCEWLQIPDRVGLWKEV